MDETIADNLASNVRQLREARGLSQAKMAQIAGIPRPTWTNLESGAANPTLAILVKVADALQVRLEELLAPPRTAARLFPAHSLPKSIRGKVTIRKLLPETVAGMEIERMELPVGARMTGIPHTPGTREYLTCETGSLELSVAGERYALTPGDVVVFRGDQKHGYRNTGSALAVAYSVIAFAPTGT